MELISLNSKHSPFLEHSFENHFTQKIAKTARWNQRNQWGSFCNFLGETILRLNFWQQFNELAAVGCQFCKVLLHDNIIGPYLHTTDCPCEDEYICLHVQLSKSMNIRFLIKHTIISFLLFSLIEKDPSYDLLKIAISTLMYMYILFVFS